MMIDEVPMNDALPREAIDAFVEKIKSDYRGWTHNMGGRVAAGKEYSVRDEMIAEFESSIRIEAGLKYLKVTIRSSVHSFICLKDSGKFKRGDILKPASWRGPATNFARGNVLEGTLDRVRWTGAL